MKCDKAQEFFSEYIENTLDAPMTVALETHLNGCEACSAEMADLRSMWAVLDKVPQVEPPADFVWRTTTRLQNEVLNRREAERAKPLPWWKRLTPAQAFSYAGIAALLVIGLRAPVVPTPLGPTTTWDIVGGIFHRTPQPVPPPPQVALVTAPQFAVQVPGAGGAAATVTITAVSDLPTAGVAMAYLLPRNEDLVGRSVRVGVPRTLPADQTFTLPVQAGGSQAVRISVFSAGQTFEKTLILPGAPLVTGPMQNASPSFALQQLATRLGKAMLVDAGLTAPVTLDLQKEGPQQALQDLLAQAGARTPVVQNGVLVITK